MASEGGAVLALTSLLSRDRTLEVIAQAGLSAEIVAWELQDLPLELREHRDHLVHVEQLSDAYMLHLDQTDVIVNYLLHIRQATTLRPGANLPWSQPT